MKIVSIRRLFTEKEEEGWRFISFLPLLFFTLVIPTFFLLDKSDNRNLLYISVIFCLFFYWDGRAVSSFIKSNKNIFIVFVIYFSYFFLSILWSDFNLEAAFKTVKIPFLVLSFMLSFFLCTQKEKNFLLIFEVVFILSAFLAGVYLLMSLWMQGVDILDVRKSYRLKGIGRVFNPNLLAQTFCVALICFLFGEIQKEVSKLKWGWIVKALIVFVFIFVIFSTGARGAGLSLLVSLLSMFFFVQKKRYFFIVLFFVLLGGGVLMFFNNNLMDSYLASADTYRFLLWREAWESIQNNFLFGIGAGTDYTFGKDFKEKGNLSGAHNILIGHMFVGGAVGVFVFFLLFFTVLYSSLKLKSDNRNHVWAIFIFAAVITQTSGHTLFLNLSSEWLFMWLPLTYVLIFRRELHDKRH